MILNGNVRGNEDRKYTFTGRVGCTVIEYVVMEGETKKWVEEMRVGDKTDSDHQLVKVTMRRKEREREKQGGRERF